MSISRSFVVPAFTCSVLVVGCAPAPEPPSRPTKVYDAATFYDSTSVSGGSFSADESRILISSDQTGTFNVFSQSVDGGEPVPLTQSTTDSLYAVSYFPADDRFLYRGDRGGDELEHLFVRELDGSVVDLTPGDGLKASFAGWSGDRRSFYATTNERDRRFFDLYRYQTDGYQRHMIYQNDGFSIGDISRDGRWLALSREVTNADSDVLLVDLTTGATAPPHQVTPDEGVIAHGVVGFTADSAQLYYSTDGAGEFEQVWSYTLATAERKPVLAADWDVQYVGFSETGRYRVSAVNADAQTKITILDTRTGAEIALPPGLEGDLGSVRFARSETRMAFYLSSDTSPSNLFVWDLEASPPAEPRQLTRTLTAAIDPLDLVDGEVVRFASFDGLEIPGILYRPHQASATTPAPAMLFMHGGPGGQSRKGYSATVQHLVNHGYAVFAVNNRGSSGYGKTFFHLDDQRHGEVDLQDCVWARRYLESLDWVNANKIGIMGGSYGGYLVAAALAFEPEAFDVGIDIFGVTNWVRTLQSMPVWWGAQRDALFAEIGDPETDLERLRRISPLFHAERIARPLLVIQGANDPRVLQVESDELVAAAKANGAPVEYVVFPDEGHGFTKKANRIAASEAFVKFLDQYLRNPPPPTGAARTSAETSG